jgi:flagellar biosynthesis regulator FlbT
MDLETRKISFVQEFLRLQSEEIVIHLENLLHKQKVELLDQEMKSMNIEQFNKEIDQSLDDAKNARIVSAKDLKSKIQKWG